MHVHPTGGATDHVHPTGGATDHVHPTGGATDHVHPTGGATDLYTLLEVNNKIRYVISHKHSPVGIILLYRYYKVCSLIT